MSKLTKSRLDLYLEQVRVLGNNAVERVIEAEKKQRQGLEKDINSQYAAEIGRINRQAKELRDSERELIDDLEKSHGKSVYLRNDAHVNTRVLNLRDDRYREPRFDFEELADTKRREIRAAQARTNSEMLRCETIEYANLVLGNFEEEMKEYD